MGCSNVYGNIGFMEEENFPVELMNACLDFFAHKNSVDLTYLGQRASGQHLIMARDTMHPEEYYLVNLKPYPPAFQRVYPNR